MFAAGVRSQRCPQCQRPFFQDTARCSVCGWSAGSEAEREDREQAYQRARKPLRARAGIAIACVGLGAVLLLMGLLGQHNDLLIFGRAIGFGGFLLYALTRFRLWRLQKRRENS